MNWIPQQPVALPNRQLKRVSNASSWRTTSSSSSFTPNKTFSTTNTISVLNHRALICSWWPLIDILNLTLFLPIIIYTQSANTIRCKQFLIRFIAGCPPTMGPSHIYWSAARLVCAKNRPPKCSSRSRWEQSNLDRDVVSASDKLLTKFVRRILRHDEESLL